jgi:hypothetical protein
VEIRSSNGTILSPSASKGKEPHLLVIFESTDLESMQVMEKSYTVRDLPHGLLYKDVLETSRLTCRVRWETALHQTFGSSSQRLLSQIPVFARSIGSAVRIFKQSLSQRAKESPPRLSLRIAASGTNREIKNIRNSITKIR